MVLGPGHTPQERKTAKIITHHLQSKGLETYSPFLDGLEADLFSMLTNDLAEGSDEKQECQHAMLLAFALDYYTLIELMDGVVLVLDGRTPDTGCVFMGAVAFASGIPVTVYKNDFRTFMPLGDNAMISGLSDFKIEKRIDDLPGKIDKLLKDSTRKYRSSNPGETLPPANRELFLLGKEMHLSLERQNQTPRGRLGHLMTEFRHSPRATSLIPDSAPSESTAINPLQISGKVYCSGPLFCPAEVKEMSDIASAVEQAGLSTYLPHRDGAEAMIGIMRSLLIRTLPFFMFSKISDRIAFSLDVSEILSCDFFVINTNGSVPDDGAVSEAGMAFAAGKPVVLFRSDKRVLLNSPYGFVHPALQVGGRFFEAVERPDNLSIQLERETRFLSGFGTHSFGSTPLPSSIHKHFRRGAAWAKIFNWLYKGKNKPIHPMVNWPGE